MPSAQVTKEVVMIQNNELLAQHEETIRFLEEQLKKERERCTNEVKQTKQKAEDEIEKQRIDYEKYLIDIRYYNEQNKLKLLKRIEDLQNQLRECQSSDESMLSLKNAKTDNPDAEIFIQTINDLNEKLTN